MWGTSAKKVEKEMQGLKQECAKKIQELKAETDANHTDLEHLQAEADANHNDVVGLQEKLDGLSNEFDAHRAQLDDLQPEVDKVSHRLTLQEELTAELDRSLRSQEEFTAELERSLKSEEDARERLKTFVTNFIKEELAGHRKHLEERMDQQTEKVKLTQERMDQHMEKVDKFVQEQLNHHKDTISKMLQASGSSRGTTKKQEPEDGLQAQQQNRAIEEQVLKQAARLEELGQDNRSLRRGMKANQEAQERLVTQVEQMQAELRRGLRSVEPEECSAEAKRHHDEQPQQDQAGILTREEGETGTLDFLSLTAKEASSQQRSRLLRSLLPEKLPAKLQVVTPNVFIGCQGTYSLVSKATTSGQKTPCWKKKSKDSSEYVLHLHDCGRWMVSKVKEGGFFSDLLRTDQTGHVPGESPTRWQFWDRSTQSWKDQDSIQVQAAGAPEVSFQEDERRPQAVVRNQRGQRPPDDSALLSGSECEDGVGAQDRRKPGATLPSPLNSHERDEIVEAAEQRQHRDARGRPRAAGGR